MKSVSEIIIRVIDSEGGLFLPVASRMARDAKLVEYWTPAWEAMPTVRRNSLGDGFENLRRVDYPFSTKNKPDLFVFPDLDFAPMQKDALERGFAVWGNRDAEELENRRGLFLDTLEKVGLPVPKHERIRGLEPLMDRLKKIEDKYIKVSKYRGDFETMHWRSWELDKTELFRRAMRLGPFGSHMMFYVFDPIDAILEDGVDTFCIDGRWPETCIHGVEKKNCGFIATVAKMSELSEELRRVNEAFGPVLAQYGARGNFSTEVRITEDEAYFIDPTIRAGIPPSQIQTEMFSNYTEFHWSGANGELVEPEPAYQFGGQVLLRAKQHKDDWTVVEFPEELKQWVKCGAACEVDGRLCIGPNAEDDSVEIGWLCAAGDTLKEFIEHLRENLELLPDGVEADAHTVADLLGEISEAEDKGLEFTEQEVPSPGAVLEPA